MVQQSGVGQHDAGKTWQDEVYDLDFTTFTGSYNTIVRMDNDTILTVAGSSQAGKTWDRSDGRRPSMLFAGSRGGADRQHEWHRIYLDAAR